MTHEEREELRKNPSAIWTGPVPEDWPLDVQIEDERGVDLMQLREHLHMSYDERLRRLEETSTLAASMLEVARKRHDQLPRNFEDPG